MVVHFEIIEFIFIFFVLVVTWFLFSDSFVTVFIEMSNIVVLMKIWYVFSTFSMS